MRTRARVILIGAVAWALSVAALVAWHSLSGGGDRPTPEPGTPALTASRGGLDLARLERETRQAALRRRAEREGEERAKPNWQEECRADPQCTAWQEEQRAALAASIPARRATYLAILASAAERDRIGNLVAERAFALAVDLPAAELHDLLSREYGLAIDVDDCEVRGDGSATCERLRAELAAIRDDFRARTSYTMTEFREGQREPTGEAMLAMQRLSERQGGLLYFARNQSAGEVAPRLISEDEARELQAVADSCPEPAGELGEPPAP